MMYKNKSKKNQLTMKQGFTLIELLTVIAIIGILASVVLVSTQGGVDKSKQASAITTASSSLPELVTCQDDNGFAKATPVEGEIICWKSAALVGVTAADGHTAKWGPIYTKTGWSYALGSGLVANGTYIFKLSKPTKADIVCDMSLNGCS